MQRRLASSLQGLMVNAKLLAMAVVCVAVGCASTPEPRVTESASSFRGESSAPRLGQVAALVLKDPFAEMSRGALPVVTLKNPFARLSPKLRNPFSRTRTKAGKPRRRSRQPRRVAELEDLALKDPFGAELKNPFR